VAVALPYPVPVLVGSTRGGSVTSETFERPFQPPALVVEGLYARGPITEERDWDARL